MDINLMSYTPEDKLNALTNQLVVIDPLLMPVPIPSQRALPRLTALETKSTSQDTAIATSTSAISDEVTARTAADMAEATARANGDSANATAITSEATTRASADTTNANAISAETTSRTAADTNLQTQVTALQSKLTQNKRGMAVGALAIGGTTTMVVTWPVAFADSNYSAIAFLEGSTTLLANVAIKGIVSRTPTTCTIMVQASGVLSAGATLAVTGIHD